MRDRGEANGRPIFSYKDDSVPVRRGWHSSAIVWGLNPSAIGSGPSSSVMVLVMICPPTLWSSTIEADPRAVGFQKF